MPITRSMAIQTWRTLTIFIFIISHTVSKFNIYIGNWYWSCFYLHSHHLGNRNKQAYNNAPQFLQHLTEVANVLQ